MGRPLNKKYFGNRNVGAPSSADDGIGGKSVASITLNAVGAYTTRPVVTLTGAPDLVGGIAATATITSEASSGAITTAGTGYVAGDTILLATAGGSATAYVSSINVGTGAITGINFTNAKADRGSFEELPGAKIVASGGTGTGAEITITFRAKAVVVVPGSGYTTTVPTAAATQSVTFTAVNMTTPVSNTAPAGSGFNPDAAIIAYAYTGSSSKQADITRQVSTDRYKVNTSDTNGTPIIAKLKTSGAASAVGEMNIVAKDAAGGTYLVSKLTSRKAVIVPAAIARLSSSAGTEFPLVNGTAQQVQWSFSTAVTGMVQIENA